MVGTVALGRPDNHNLTGRFNEPYARRSPPLPRLSPGWSFNYSGYPRMLDHPTPTADVTSVSPRPAYSFSLIRPLPALTGQSRRPFPAISPPPGLTPRGRGLARHGAPPQLHRNNDTRPTCLFPILNRRDGREIIKTYNGIEIVSLSINAIRRLRAGRRVAQPPVLTRRIQFSFGRPRLICVLIRG